MDVSTIAWITIAVLCMATLYSTVGHGGGSGYLAVLALAAVAPEQMRPTALLLNIVVSSIATWKFTSVDMFRKDIFVPLICASVPAAFIGGLAEVSPQIYHPVVGLVLLFASVRLFIPMHGAEKTMQPRIVFIVVAGCTIGFVSGIIGVGGGIFLSPLILLLGWTTAKQTAAISAPFILANSISGVCGIAVENSGLPIQYSLMAPLAVAVVVGGYIGASFGSRKLGHVGLRTVLGVVLCLASGKMFLSTFVSL